MHTTETFNFLQENFLVTQNMKTISSLLLLLLLHFHNNSSKTKSMTTTQTAQFLRQKAINCEYVVAYMLMTDLTRYFPKCIAQMSNIIIPTQREVLFSDQSANYEQGYCVRGAGFACHPTLKSPTWCLRKVGIRKRVTLKLNCSPNIQVV